MADTSANNIHAEQRQQTPAVLDVRVLEPGDASNVYAWDAQAGALRFERVLRPAMRRGADLARLPLLSSLAERTARVSTATPVEVPSRKFRFGELSPSTAAPSSSASDDPSGKAAEDAPAGPGLLVLLLADPPNPPDVWVRARVVGAWRPDEGGDFAETAGVHVQPFARDSSAGAERGDLDALGQWTLIAVPEADEALAGIASVTELPDDARSHLDQALRSLGAPAGGRGVSGEWLDARDALDLCNRARLIARRTYGSGAPSMAMPRSDGLRRRAGDDETEGRVAWRALSRLTPAELRALGPGAYSEAEHLLRFVPTRFGHYLNELLLPDERVVFFAERSSIQLRASGIQALLPGRRRIRLQAGLLLVTDHQVLCLRDYAPPDATLVEWGYLARSYPLGRVVGAVLLPPGQTVEAAGTRAAADVPGLLGESTSRIAAALEAADAETRRELAAEHLARLLLVVEARGGIEVGVMAMPATALGGMDWAASLLREFAPRPAGPAAADRRVSRLPAVEPWRPSEAEATALEGLGGEIASPLRVALDDTLSAALAPGEEPLVVARAADIALSGAGQVAALLLALTERQLLVVRTRRPLRSRSGADQPETTVVAVPLGEISSATLQHSLLGCALWAHRPGPPAGAPSRRDTSEDTNTVAVGFASPAITPFRALFVRLRAQLGGPIASRTT